MAAACRLRPGAGQVDQLELTDVHGAENLQRLTYRPGDIVLGDRYYARPRDLRPVIEAGADFIVRTGWNSLRLLQPDGEPLIFRRACRSGRAGRRAASSNPRRHEGPDAPWSCASLSGARTPNKRRLSRSGC